MAAFTNDSSNPDNAVRQLTEENNSYVFFSFALNHLVPSSLISCDNNFSRCLNNHLSANIGSKLEEIGSVAENLVLPEHVLRNDQKNIVFPKSDYILVSECLKVASEVPLSSSDNLFFFKVQSEETGVFRLACHDASECQLRGCELVSRGSETFLSDKSNLEVISLCVASKPNVITSAEQTAPRLNRVVTEGLELESWPKECVEFVRRQQRNQWPGRAALQEVVKQKVLCVPLTVSPLYDADESILWTHWFCFAEKSLASFLTSHHKQLFSILKLVNAYFFGELLIPTTILKHIFFWFCEETAVSQCQTVFLGRNVIELLTRISNGLKNNKIPNYFMPSSNLLCCCEVFHREDIVKKLDLVLQEPFILFSYIDNAVLLPCSLTVSKHSEILSTLFSIQASNQSDLVKHQIIPATVKIAEAFLVQNLLYQKNLGFSSFSMVENCFQIAKIFFEKVMDLNFPLYHFVDLLIRFIDPDLVAHYVLQKTKDCPEDAAVVNSCNNLACQLAIRAHQETSHRSQVLKCLAKSLHEAVLVSSHSNPATMVDHAKMHLSFGETEAAVQLFEAASKPSAHAVEATELLKHLNCFDENEKALLCTPLREVLLQRGLLTLPASVLALFHLTWIYSSETTSFSARNCHLQELTRQCELLRDEPSHSYQIAACSFSLLARCHQKLGDSVSAELALQVASDFEGTVQHVTDLTEQLEVS